ncbi:N-acetylneuraminate synthase family protein [Dyadobacter psychrotolerans]|uniref:N-acetylneuraminate synthase n=1 Tax=Dyadobacter psychrotolerans TaxID=2541721 RepID=A0A4R5DI73_9BACT|nr:N-acetylneuraminate synthase family protein [Dyadobacter psychrotolerans]TDE11604.1 N-acetylneuraminate synthase [Dyadobacter psychrotolerans]
MAGIYLIAEIGQAHEGSLGLAHSYIDALAGTGINAVKFQVHIAEAESSIYEQFRTPFSYLNESRMEYWKRMEFTPEQWQELKKHCEEKRLEFLATPSSLSAAELLNNLNVNKFKIGSGDVSNFLLLNYLAGTGKEIILSSGMSSIDELDESIAFLQTKTKKLSILQCTCSYPAAPEQWGLNFIKEFKKRYEVRVGFSDHSGDIFACLAATSQGAEILEFHTVFDQRMFGPDATSSINIDQVPNLVKGVRQIKIALSNPVTKTGLSQIALKAQFEKSLAVNKNLNKGQVISINDLESKKPKGKGISPLYFEKVVGKRLSHDLKKWDFVNERDLL